MAAMSVTSSVLSQTQKFLKIPRVYNALITSDQALLPSQAYPAISPVIQGVQYPLTSGFFAPGPYQALFAQNQIPSGAVLLDNSGSFTYSVRRENSSPEDGSTYRYGVQSGYGGGNDDNRSSSFTRYPNNRFTLPNTAPVPGTNFNSAPNEDVVRNDAESTQRDNDAAEKSYRYDLGFPDDPAQSNSTNVATLQQLESVIVDQQQPVPNDEINGDFVKNNRPSNPDIVDVPPPPLPVGQPKSNNQKVPPQEYPPPPGGFVI